MRRNGVRRRPAEHGSQFPGRLSCGYSMSCERLANAGARHHSVDLSRCERHVLTCGASAPWHQGHHLGARKSDDDRGGRGQLLDPHGTSSGPLSSSRRVRDEDAEAEVAELAQQQRPGSPRMRTPAAGPGRAVTCCRRSSTRCRRNSLAHRSVIAGPSSIRTPPPTAAARYRSSAATSAATYSSRVSRLRCRTGRYGVSDRHRRDGPHSSGATCRPGLLPGTAARPAGTPAPGSRPACPTSSAG